MRIEAFINAAAGPLRCVASLIAGSRPALRWRILDIIHPMGKSVPYSRAALWRKGVTLAWQGTWPRAVAALSLPDAFVNINAQPLQLTLQNAHSHCLRRLLRLLAKLVLVPIYILYRGQRNLACTAQNQQHASLINQQDRKVRSESPVWQADLVRSGATRPFRGRPLARFISWTHNPARPYAGVVRLTLPPPPPRLAAMAIHGWCDCYASTSSL